MKIVEILSDCFDIYPFEGDSTSIMVRRGTVLLPQIAWMPPEQARLYGEAVIHAAAMSEKLSNQN